MPQLDKFSFATQIFWLLLLFFFMYILMLKIILPMLYRIIKIRKEFLNNLILDTQALTDESFFVNSIYKDLFTTILVKTFDFFSSFKSRILFFKNLCNVFVVKSDFFSETREIYKNNTLLLKVKKVLLNNI